MDGFFRYNAEERKRLFSVEVYRTAVFGIGLVAFKCNGRSDSGRAGCFYNPVQQFIVHFSYDIRILRGREHPITFFEHFCHTTHVWRFQGHIVISIRRKGEFTLVVHRDSLHILSLKLARQDFDLSFLSAPDIAA